MENKLKDIYINYLRMYSETGVKPRIDEMLLILLLDNINYFEPLKLPTKDFYKFYQRIIEEKITNIKKDFKITTEDINNLKKEENIEELDDYFLYEKVLVSIHTYLKENKNIKPIEIYYEYYHDIYGVNLNKNNKRRILSRIIKKEN